MARYTQAERPCTLDPQVKPTLSVDEFAIVAGISRSTAFAAVHSGDVPSIRFGKRIRIPTQVVRNLLRLDEAAPEVGGAA